MTCYYAHSIGLYDTKQEERDILLLKHLGFSILSPNSEEHSKGYKKAGMDYFMKIISDDIDVLAFRSNPDGSINAGTAKEISRARELRIPVIELPCSIISRTLSVEETRERLRNEGTR